MLVASVRSSVCPPQRLNPPSYVRCSLRVLLVSLFDLMKHVGFYENVGEFIYRCQRAHGVAAAQQPPASVTSLEVTHPMDAGRSRCAGVRVRRWSWHGCCSDVRTLAPTGSAAVRVLTAVAGLPGTRRTDTRTTMSGWTSSAGHPKITLVAARAGAVAALTRGQGVAAPKGAVTRTKL